MIYGLKIKYKRLHIIRYNCRAKSYARSRTGSYFSHKLEGVIVALKTFLKKRRKEKNEEVEKGH